MNASPHLFDLLITRDPEDLLGRCEATRALVSSCIPRTAISHAATDLTNVNSVVRVYVGGGISSHWVTFISPLYCSFGGINSMKDLLRCTYQDLTVHKQEIGSFYSQIFEAFKSNSRKFDAWHLFLQTWKFSYLSAIMLWKTFVKYSYIYYN